MFLSFGSREGISPQGFYVFPVLILTTACFLLSYGEKNLVRVGTEQNLKIHFEEMTECSEEGLFGNELDCSAFYQCTVDGQHQHNGSSQQRYKKYDFKCPPGTVFDTKIKNCNHPSDSTPLMNCDGNGTHLTTTRPRPQAQSKVAFRFYKYFGPAVNKNFCLVDNKTPDNLLKLDDCKEKRKNQLWIPIDLRGKVEYPDGRFKNMDTGRCWFVEAINTSVTLVECGKERTKKTFFQVSNCGEQSLYPIEVIIKKNAECCFEFNGLDRVDCGKFEHRKEVQLWRRWNIYYDVLLEQ